MAEYYRSPVSLESPGTKWNNFFTSLFINNIRCKEMFYFHWIEILPHVNSALPEVSFWYFRKGKEKYQD